MFKSSQTENEKFLQNLNKTELDYEKHNLNLTDKECAETLQHMHSLKKLNLSGTLVTNKGIRFLKSLVNLEELTLKNTNITGECFYTLFAFKNLVYLDIRNIKVSDENFKLLLKHPNLKTCLHDKTGELQKKLEIHLNRNATPSLKTSKNSLKSSHESLRDNSSASPSPPRTPLRTPSPVEFFFKNIFPFGKNSPPHDKELIAQLSPTPFKRKHRKSSSNPL